MQIGRPRGDPWLWPAGPTAADEVEFNREHYLSANVVGYWVARGDVLQDMLATNGDMIAANSGSADSTPGGLAWGNVNATSVPGYLAHSTAWKPSSAVTVAALCGAARAGTNAAINTHLFGCEGTNNGWGVYFNGVGQTRAYCRVGAAWADQLAMVTWDQSPRLVGFTFDGSTFTARHDSASATQSISGSVTNSTVSLDLLGRGGLATTNGRAGVFQAFLIFDRALSAAEWADLGTAPFQLLRTVRQFVNRGPYPPLTAEITGDIPVTAAIAAELTPLSGGNPHGVLRRGRRGRNWQNVPEELKPVVALAEEWSEADPVARAVEEALAKHARITLRTSAARRARLIDEAKRAVIAAVERAAEMDDEEALIALL